MSTYFAAATTTAAYRVKPMICGATRGTIEPRVMKNSCGKVGRGRTIIRTPILLRGTRPRGTRSGAAGCASTARTNGLRRVPRAPGPRAPGPRDRGDETHLREK